MASKVKSRRNYSIVDIAAYFIAELFGVGPI